MLLLYSQAFAVVNTGLKQRFSLPCNLPCLSVSQGTIQNSLQSIKGLPISSVGISASLVAVRKDAGITRRLQAYCSLAGPSAAFDPFSDPFFPLSSIRRPTEG